MRPSNIISALAAVHVVAAQSGTPLSPPSPSTAPTNPGAVNLILADAQQIRVDIGQVTTAIERFYSVLSVDAAVHIEDALHDLTRDLDHAANDANAQLSIDEPTSATLVAEIERSVPLIQHALSILTSKGSAFTSGLILGVFGPPVIRHNLRQVEASAEGLGTALAYAVAPSYEQEVLSDFGLIDSYLARAIEVYS